MTEHSVFEILEVSLNQSKEIIFLAALDCPCCQGTQDWFNRTDLIREFGVSEGALDEAEAALHRREKELELRKQSHSILSFLRFEDAGDCEGFTLVQFGPQISDGNGLKTPTHNGMILSEKESAP